MLTPLVEPRDLKTTRLQCICGWAGRASETLLGETSVGGGERLCPRCTDRLVALVPHHAPLSARNGTPLL
ncbi:MAG: hypothetical protein AB7G13_21725 [Lautropia sp.]